MSRSRAKLAIDGGPKVREAPMPGRRQFGEEALERVREVFERAWSEERDFGFQGEFEERYTRAFCDFQGGGRADAVSSGTAAVFACLAALELPRGAEVVVSPVTDPGGIAPACVLGLTPVLADSAPGGFNIGPEQFEAALTSETRAAAITHLGGVPVEIDAIAEIARDRDVALVEDCSQAHGALCNGRRVGTFGQLAAFSTMFSKGHATGGCGGVVFTGVEDLYWRVRALADRGKNFAREDFDPKDPAQSLFASLNFNLDELSCAIGLSTLGKLQATIDRRLEIVAEIEAGLAEMKSVSPIKVPVGLERSPFFHTVRVNGERLTRSANEFARAVQAEGIPINPRYQLVAAEWPWLRSCLSSSPSTPNAVAFRDSSFNILFHERFGPGEIADILEAIGKVEAACLR